MGWEIVRVPEKPPGSPQQSTVDVIASNVEPKLANTLVRQLSQVAPLEDLRHVKRVQRRSVEGKNELSIILCPSVEHENKLKGIPDDVLKLINVYHLCPFVTKVAKYAASSKEEWEEQCKLWPTSYHPMFNVDSAVAFSEEDSKLIFNYMKIAIKLARSSQLSDQAINAAVIVDPSSGQIIASATDQIYSMSCNTSGSNLKSCSCMDHRDNISLLESDENKGAYNEESIQMCTSGEFTQSCTVSCLYPWRWTEQGLYTGKSLVKSQSNYSWHPLRHATLAAIENAAARDRQLFPNLVSSEDHSIDSNALHSSSMNLPAKRQKIQNTENEEKLVNGDAKSSLPEAMRPYLCTGFDIYLVWEPCTMCAMALVHQRIRRIFYAFPNPNVGALGSVYRLQGEKSLNHHYYVFRILLTEEALDDIAFTDSRNNLLQN